MHRDISAETLYLTSTEDTVIVKLADFSLACDVLHGPASGHCGRPYYVAPEILRKKPYGRVRPLLARGVGVSLFL